MTRILIAPYQNRESMKLEIIKLNNIIYINDIKVKEQDISERNKMFCFYGYKFETLSTIPKLTNDKEELEKMLKERSNEIVDNHIESASVFETKLGEHSLLMGAEVDCIDDTNRNSYVELKTSRIIENEKQQFSFERYKLLKFWAQSYLAGIPKIVIGFRDDNGMLKQIKTLNTLEIPNMVKGKRSEWDPNVCLCFANGFFNWLKQNISGNNQNNYYIVNYDSSIMTFNIQKENNSCEFLLMEYLNSIKSFNQGGDIKGSLENKQD
ncbi:RAI1-domain-containing protein [Neoconidiobolus thromboides FSU 785]|nr:RAI1-domain-containing protein [Neoconidiobolus thromboides FSU 785]